MSLLRLESVDKSFWRGPNELVVLRGVSLEVRAGDFVAIYGQRSSGKTTLLKLAAGFETPDAGTVAFDGHDLLRLSRRGIARVHREEIGWVERSGPHSRDLSVRVYVSLPLYGKLGRREAERRAGAALARVGAADCADQCWDDLSDAVRMMVAIAQALVREPQLLIVDDPTAGLGIVDRERIVGLLRSAADDGGVGVLMAVPDLPAMLSAHQVRSLSRGRLLAPPEPPGGRGTVVEFPRGQRRA